MRNLIDERHFLLSRAENAQIRNQEVTTNKNEIERKNSDQIHVFIARTVLLYAILQAVSHTMQGKNRYNDDKNQNENKMLIHKITYGECDHSMKIGQENQW